jgi:hypothetical protein
LEAVDHATWLASLGDDFAVPVVDQTGAPGELTLRLAAVTERRIDGGYATYRLEFSGPSTMPLDQGMITLRHGAHDEQALFVVPVGQAGDARTYEAVISEVSA